MQTIDQLSSRVDALEGSGGYKFILPLAVSIIAIIVSAVTASRAKSFSEAQLKSVALQGVKSNVDAARAQIESLSMEIAPLKAIAKQTKEQKSEFEIKQKILDSAFERLLNAYDDGCSKFFKHQVPQQDFADLYHSDIADYVREFEDKFSGPLTRFGSMLRYYTEKHVNVKVS
jgi:hypothetical protein